MRLKPRDHLGSFEVVAAIGAGGMGEVYKARDLKLNREVALKVLPEKFALDPERLARFRREAQVLASLNHPNIAHVYGIEEAAPEGLAAPLSALVMEFVEGPTLADRLASEPLPVLEALRVAIKIAEGLEAAHEKGIVHRDLKPANIKLAPGGAVKILDFGLAKALGEPESAGDLTHSPTFAAPATHAGVILGTAAYMSPEQAEGRLVDKRTDIWAFGTVLFEMLTGRRVFDGKSISHVIVHVLEQEPDWGRLPTATPRAVRELLERCLQKDPAKRPREISDLRLQLEAVISQPESARASVPSSLGAALATRPRMGWLWPIAATVAVAMVVLIWVFARPSQKTAVPEPVRFEIAQPGNVNFSGSLSVSPDGRSLAFIATTDGTRRIWIRTLNALEARPLAGTEGVDGVPFWSPDGHSIGFSANGSLKKIDISGGPPQVLATLMGSAVSGFWTADGGIIFGTNEPSGIQRVAATGGVPTSLTKIEGVTTADTFPVLLPDGRHFLFARLSIGGAVNGGVFVSSLESQSDSISPKRLLADSSPVAYASSSDVGIGYILFVRGNPRALVAQRFDTRKLALVGEPAVIVEDFAGTGFSVSNNGVLVYATGAVPLRNQTGAVIGQLTWFDRQGNVLGTIDDPAIYLGVELSPDDSQAAFARIDTSGNVDIWVADLTRGTTRRLTFDAGVDTFPVWSPDGKRIAFASSRSGQLDLYAMPSNGEGEEKVLLASKEGKVTLSWSSDGRFLLYGVGPAAQTDVWMLPMDGSDGPKPLPVLASMFRELAFFSPDNRWISYISTESGPSEAYVRSFDSRSPASGAKTLVSRGGARNTRWRADGKELFYHNEAGEMMAVDVTTAPTFHAGTPKVLFKGASGLYWTVTRDGQRFLMPVPAGPNSPTPYRVMLNWTSAFTR